MTTSFNRDLNAVASVDLFATTLLRVSALAVLLAVAACGGGGGDGGGAAPPPLAVGTFVKTYSPAVSGNLNFPFYLGDDKHQTLYTASEVGGAGKISALHFRRAFAVATPVTCPNATVRLGHTSLSALTSDFASNIDRSSLVTALNNATVTIPAGAANTWFEIPFTTPFGYNGVDNLVVEIEKTAGCTENVSVTVFSAATDRRAFSYAVDSDPATAQHNQTTASTVDTVQLWAKFAFAGGDDKIDLGGAGSNSWPFAIAIVGVSERPRIQNLYLASEINGSGPVTGIAFQMNATSPGSNYTYSLKLGHSTLAALGNTFASNYSGSPMTVANAVTFSIPAGIPAGEWVWVPIPDGVFTYNGTDNLIVEVAAGAGTASTPLRYASIAGRRVWVNDTTGTATTGAVDPVVNHIALRFHGGPVSVLTNGGIGTTLAFSATITTGGLNLYRATELGSAGTITSVACRMWDLTSTATSYANYRVIIGHSNRTSLSATTADNFVSQTTAVSGTVSVPAGLVRGDWIEVPLSTPFTYDGKRNLAIWMGTTGASGAVTNHNCKTSSAVDAARYPGQMASGVPGAGSVMVWDYKGDMKLKISR